MKAEADREISASRREAGRNSEEAAAAPGGHGDPSADESGGWTQLMEAVVERGNMRLAYQRVGENKGAAGVDEHDGGRAQRLI